MLKSNKQSIFESNEASFAEKFDQQVIMASKTTQADLTVVNEAPSAEEITAKKSEIIDEEEEKYDDYF